MATLLLLAGIGLIFLIAFDFLSTVLTVAGGGPVSRRLHAWAWQLMLKLHRRRRRHTLLSWVGPVFTILSILFWGLGVWLGWVLVFSSESGSIVDATTGAYATLSERFYFVGYSLTTLGLGDFKPSGSTWQIATVLTAASGLFLFTMAITYIVPIIEALAQARSLAAYIGHLGETPVDIVENSWYASSFDSVDAHLTALAPMVDSMGQLFLAYPILHYFHSPQSSTSLPVRLASLDEALTLLNNGVTSDRIPAPQTINPLRHSITEYLEVLHSAHINPEPEAPAILKLNQFRSSDLPLVSQADFDAANESLSKRRCRLLALTVGNGWTWNDVQVGAASESGWKH